MVLTVIDVLFVFVISFLIIKFNKTRAVSFMGTVGTAYVVGIIYSLIVMALMSFGVVRERDTTALEILGYVGIAIGIPLLLFSSNIKYTFKLSGKVLFAYFLLLISAFCVCMVSYLLFARRITDGDILTGMAMGLYSGGTTNLNAVAGVFRLDQQTIVMANLSDMIFGGIFYIFLVFAAKPLVGKVLPKGKTEGASELELRSDDECGSFSIKSKGVIRNFFISLAMVIVSAGVGFGIFVAKGSVDGTLIDCLLPAILIGTAVLGIVASLNSKISSVKENSTMGQFFVTVFSCAVASMFDFSKLSIAALGIFALYAGITVSIFIVHMLLCLIFKIDSSTMIVTSVAGIYGPAFIPGVTKAIKAEDLLPAGLITGSIGYAVGTFLGIAVVYLCRL